MLVSEFDYELPAELIAQHPLPQRSASRLLRLDAKSGALEDRAFTDLASLVDARDAVVINDTRVVKARLFGRKRSGGKVEVFVERALGTRSALAAPTAGLHFDEALLQKIRDREARILPITLHVGAGTFQPVRGETVENHRMHKERYVIPSETMKAISGHRVLAVGTTSLRAIESAARSGALSGETDLFIYPGFEFRLVRRLLTNFHLPRSTLLMLVSAFAGRDNIKHAYAHAIAKRYRFYSYGDAMLIET